MKHIIKSREPAGLRDWKLKSRSAPQNLSYDNFSGEPLAELRLALLREQGFLCAYTMLRLKDETKGHIEHLNAQTLEPDRDLDYANMVYCHPGTNAPRCPFGAHAKDDAQISRDDFVSPLDADCEQRLIYRRTGEILPARPQDRAAHQTIKVILKLCHRELVNQRRAAIEGLPIFKRSERRFSSQDAARLAAALERTDSEGRFRPFAPALRQFLLKFAERKAVQEKPLRSVKSNPGDR